MNQLCIYTLKVLRKLYVKAFRVQPLPKPICEQDPDIISRIIYDKLIDDKPCMIARFGSTELSTIVNYWGVKNPNKNFLQYIQGRSLPWWWNSRIMEQMQRWSGFFPPTQVKIEQFCELILEDMKEVDVLGSWLADEARFESLLEQSLKVRLIFIDPFWSTFPWTKALEGKTILVVHPFASLIEQQYRAKRLSLFKNKDVLPHFKLITIKAVQSLGGDNNGYRDWFEALDSMKDQIDQIDFDICLLGCGAYGFPLAAHVKRKGKKAVHWGGSLQLYFGIIGKRWEDPNYASGVRHINPNVVYPSLINSSWIRPDEMQTQHSQNVEDGCYW